MSFLFGRRSGGEESRTIDSGVFDRIVASEYGADSGLRLAAVYSAVALLSDAAASLPLHQYRRRGDGRRERIHDSSLMRNPSALFTTFDWVHQPMTSLLLRGNAYGWVTSRDRYGYPRMVEWLPPSQVNVDTRGLTGVGYSWQGSTVPAADVIHIRAFPEAGKPVSLSPIAQFASVFGAGLSASKALADWYKNGTTPSMLVQNTQKALNQQEADRIKERFQAKLQAGEPVVTGSDWKLDTFGVSAQDAQYLEAMKLNATQVAAIYRVPPEWIGGEAANSLTYSTTEQYNLQFLLRSLLPWLRRFEVAISEALPAPQFVKFNTDAGLRTDAMTEAKLMDLQLRNGLLTLDEARVLKEREPLTPAQVAGFQTIYGGNTPPPPTDMEGMQDEPRNP